MMLHLRSLLPPGRLGAVGAAMLLGALEWVALWRARRGRQPLH